MSKKNIFVIASLILAFAGTSCASLFGARGCTVNEKSLTDPNFSLEYSQYINSSSTKKSLIIMPPTGGVNFIDKRYANEFCSAGYHVYVIKSWTNPNKSSDIGLERHQRDHERAQASISKVIAEIQTPFIGLLGTSLGGMYAAVAANYQDKINAVFLIVAGAPVTEVIVKSDQDVMQELLKRRKEKFGYKTDDEYLQALERAFFLEPMKLGEKYKTKDIGMVIATQDEKVPTKNQKALADFFKPKKVITYESSHLWGIVKPWLFSSDEIIEFFDESSKKHIP
jgi:dienelactone hydrolase